MVAIVDIHGNPIRNAQKSIKEPQTARVGHLAGEFATHPSRGLTPSKLAKILEDAEQGNIMAQHDLFSDMEEKDPHIYSEMSKRRHVLLGLDWNIEPPRNADKKEESTTELLSEIISDIPDIEDIINDMSDAIGHGFSALEIEWHRLGKYWLPKSITHRPQSWFVLDPATRTQLLLRDNNTEGSTLQPFGWILHQHKAKPGYIGRSGLHRILAWPYLFKNYSIRDLAEFLEIYGLPLRLGSYPPGARDKEKSTLLQAVIGIGHSAAGIIPEGMKIDFKEAAKGTHDPFQAMIDWCESSQSKAILGGTLTTSAQNTGMGSNLGDVHNEVRHDIRNADCRQIASTLSRDLVYAIGAINGLITEPAQCPKWVFDTREPEDLSLYAEAIPKLVSVGTPVPVNWVMDKLNIPEPAEGEAVLQTVSASTPTETVPLKAKVPTENDVVTAQITRMQKEGDATVGTLIDSIKAMLDSAESLDAFSESLLNAYGDLDSKELANVMQLGLAAAELAGRLEVT